MTRYRSGFTLIEFLSVLAVITVVAALLMPSVLRVREAARNIQCKNNLRQVGLALQNYHEVNCSFPLKNGNARFCVASSVYGGNRGLYDRYDHHYDYMAPMNIPLGQIAISLYRCPSGLHEVFAPNGLESGNYLMNKNMAGDAEEPIKDLSSFKALACEINTTFGYPWIGLPATVIQPPRLPPHSSHGNLLMGDGSAQSISESVEDGFWDRVGSR
jgi:prepilin-type N-terminal cleavage/methylation domain-containing protein